MAIDSPSSLLASNGRRYVVEPGVLDDRARLAFTSGHCHSLALALHGETGGEMLGFTDTATPNPFDHVLVRSSDGRLIDIGGARTTDEVLQAGGHLSPVSTAILERLPVEDGWVRPDPEAASAWLPPLLEQVSAGDSHRKIRCFVSDFMLDPLLAIHIEWTDRRDGAERLRAFGRRQGATPRAWTRCSTASIPTNAEGERVIDFTQQAFECYARRFEEAIRRSRAKVIANLDDPTLDEPPVCPPR